MSLTKKIKRHITESKKLTEEQIAWFTEVIEHEKMSDFDKKELVAFLLKSAQEKHKISDEKLKEIIEKDFNLGLISEKQKEVLLDGFIDIIKLLKFEKGNPGDSVFEQWRKGSSFIITLHKFGFGRKTEKVMKNDDSGKEIFSHEKYVEHHVNKAWEVIDAIRRYQKPWMKKIKIALDLDLLYVCPTNKDTGTDFDDLPPEEKRKILFGGYFDNFPERYKEDIIKGTSVKDDKIKKMFEQTGLRPPSKIYLAGEFKEDIRLFFGHKLGIKRPDQAKNLLKIRKNMWLTGGTPASYIFKNFKNPPPELVFSIEIKLGIGDSKKVFKKLISMIREANATNNVMFQSRYMNELEILRDVLREEGLDKVMPITLFSKGKWKPMLRPPWNITKVAEKGPFDAITGHFMPGSLRKYIQVVTDIREKCGKFSYPFITEPAYWKKPMLKVNTKKAKKVKKKLLMALLAGCTGGFVEREYVDVLVDFVANPLSYKGEKIDFSEIR